MPVVRTKSTPQARHEQKNRAHLSRLRNEGRKRRKLLAACWNLASEEKLWYKRCVVQKRVVRCGVLSICRANNRKGKPAAVAKKGGRAKNRTKTGEKGLKSELSPSFCTFGVKVLSGGVCAASLSSVEQTITKLSQQQWQKPRKKGERSDKQSRNSGKGRTNHKVVEHQGQKSENAS